MEISVIVPIYKGKKYIKQVINQVEVCAKRLSDNKKVELLLINDWPDEIIENQKSNLIDVLVFNTDVNLGIQGARIKGYKLSRGKFIVFLDQDDRISEDYLSSQLDNIHSTNSDASICRATENGRCVYNMTNPFERTIDKFYMMNVGNAIVSPGQVLIRKSVIPFTWEKSILKHNGVDDWLLWLCMMGEKRKFVLNDSVLFEHVVDGNNSSWNSVEMLMSEREMYDVLKESKLLEKKELIALETLIEKEPSRYINILENYRKMFFLYEKWMTLEHKKGNISDFLYENGYQKIAIYGMGYIGEQLLNGLQNTPISVSGIIDINAEYIDMDIPITSLAQFNQTVDLVIVTLIQESKNILFEIEGKTQVPVIVFQDLLTKWEKWDGYE